MRYSIILNSETKEFSCDYLKIQTVCGGRDITWSKRLINCLQGINTEYVLFFLDDEFLLKPVNVDAFNKVILFMNENPDVGVLYPHKNKKQILPVTEDYFPRDLITLNRRLVCICALWRKSYLLKILREEESPWDFEANAPERSKQYPERLLQYNKRLPDLITYDDQIDIGYGITAKKWLPKTKELFDRYGIKVNYDNLGFYPYENQRIEQLEERKKRKARGQKTLNPIEIVYGFKSRIKKCINEKRATRNNRRIIKERIKSFNAIIKENA